MILYRYLRTSLDNMVVAPRQLVASLRMIISLSRYQPGKNPPSFTFTVLTDDVRQMPAVR